MKKITATLGYELNIHEGGAWLKEEELQRIDAALSATGQASPDAEAHASADEVAALQTQITALQTRMEAMEGQLTTAQEEVSTLKTEVDRIGGEPGAGPTRPAAQADSYKDQGYGQNPLAVLEAAASDNEQLIFN